MINLKDNLHNMREKGALYGWVINYQYVTNGGKIRGSQDSTPYKNNKLQNNKHIIEMILDLDEYNLRFTHNGIDQGIAFKHIDKASYRAVFGACKKGDKLELLSYTNQ